MHSTVLLLGQGSVGRWEGGAEQSTAGRYPRGVRPAGQQYPAPLSSRSPSFSGLCCASSPSGRGRPRRRPALLHGGAAFWGFGARLIRRGEARKAAPTFGSGGRVRGPDMNSLRSLRTSSLLEPRAMCCVRSGYCKY
jgi:hypothetical protein